MQLGHGRTLTNPGAGNHLTNDVIEKLPGKVRQPGGGGRRYFATASERQWTWSFLKMRSR